MTSFAPSSSSPSTVPSTGEEESTEILQLMQEALNLANVAVLFDKQDNFVGAYDYYDKCILNIDEVMSKLPKSSSQWMTLMDLRSQYDDRMDSLKEMEASRTSMMSNFGLASNKPVSESNKSTKSNKHKHKVSSEDVNFSELTLDSFHYEEPPKDMPQIPFWQLRCIQRTIETGGYLSDSLFIPKNVWQQTDVKFSGIQIKSTAFEIIIRLITNQIEILSMRVEEATMAAAEQVFSQVAEELLALQNQLSKSFPYIKEIVVVDRDEAEAAYGRDSLFTSPNANANNGNNSANNTPTMSSKNAANKSLSQYVTTFGKNMKKYAEVGLSRLAVAMPSKLSTEELTEYTNLVCKLCEKTQILPSWYLFIERIRDENVTITNPIKADHMDISSKQHSGEHLVAHKEIPTPSVLNRLDNISIYISTITNVIRDVVCEILLRDVENLLEKYMVRTRKSYSRMYWDQENFSGNE